MRCISSVSAWYGKLAQFLQNVKTIKSIVWHNCYVHFVRWNSQLFKIYTMSVNSAYLICNHKHPYNRVEKSKQNDKIRQPSCQLYNCRTWNSGSTDILWIDGDQQCYESGCVPISSIHNGL